MPQLRLGDTTIQIGTEEQARVHVVTTTRAFKEILHWRQKRWRRPIILLGWVMQASQVTVGGNVTLVGSEGTKISGPVYIKPPGLHEVQDATRIPLKRKESVWMYNTTDGEILVRLYLNWAGNPYA